MIQSYDKSHRVFGTTNIYINMVNIILLLRKTKFFPIK